MKLHEGVAKMEEHSRNESQKLQVEGKKMMAEFEDWNQRVQEH